MTNLQKHKLGELLDVTRGASLPGANYSTSGSLIRLTLGNFDEKGGWKANTSKDNLFYTGQVASRFILKEGDIITPLTEQTPGLLGSTARVPESGKYIQSQDVALVKCNPALLDENFAYYLISSPSVKKQLGAASQQTKIRHTSPDKIKECIVYIPNIDYQKKAGSLLGRIDEKISTNKKIIKTLSDIARTIYEYWFLQFEFPGTGTPYKSSGGKMVWNKELKREIPEGWKVNRLPDCSDVRYGFPLSTEHFCNTGMPVVRIRDIIGNSISAYTTECVDDVFLTKSGDLLIGMDGNFQMNYWNRTGDCVNQRIVRIRRTSVPVMLIRFQIEPIIQHSVDSVARSTVGHLSDKDIKNLFILCPTSTVNLTVFEKTLTEICNLKSENQQLVSLRDFLLPLLMNEQVKIG